MTQRLSEDCLKTCLTVSYPQALFGNSASLSAGNAKVDEAFEKLFDTAMRKAIAGLAMKSFEKEAHKWGRRLMDDEVRGAAGATVY